MQIKKIKAYFRISKYSFLILNFHLTIQKCLRVKNLDFFIFIQRLIQGVYEHGRDFFNAKRTYYFFWGT